MVAWLTLLTLSVAFGAAVSFIPSKWAWLLILPAPLLVVFALNYYYDRLPPSEPGASMSALAYLFAGMPAICIALVTYYLFRYYRSSLR